MNEYEENVKNIEKVLQTFKQHGTITDAIKITNLKLNELKNKIASLTPNKRSKRGLFNGLGTAIKFISGNMDDKDAQHLNKEIEDLKQNKLTTEINIAKQHNLNTQMIERFKNLTSHINKEQNKMEIYLKQLSQTESNRIYKQESTLEEIQYLNQINYNIDLLSEHITNLAESVVLAKLNIISKLILNKNELEIIYKHIVNQSVNLVSDEHIYELLGLQAYYNSSNIIFNIKIPILSVERFNFYHIIPLPINDTKQIIIKPYVIYNENTVHYFDTTCTKLEQTYYCPTSQHQETIKESACLGQLLSNKIPRCAINNVGKISKIWQPEDNYIILINVLKTLVNSTCSSNPNFIEDTALIHFKDCTININGINYEDNANIFWDEVHVAPPTYTVIRTENEVETLTLEKLQEDQFKNRDAVLVLAEQTTKRASHTHIAAGILTLLTILAVIIAIRTKKTQYIMQQPPIIAPAISQSLWPSLYSKGGGVMSPPHNQH